jgi:hypothetical protein
VVKRAASALAGLALGVSLFLGVATSAPKPHAPAFVQLAANNYCDAQIEAGIYTECDVLDFIGSNPETDLVYGQFIFRERVASGDSAGIIFRKVFTEGEEVVGVQ